MFGLFSNHPLTDAAVYADDVVLHASDQDAAPYYRPLDSLDDGLAMEGNCNNAGAGFGKNEMYPCFDASVTYGLAVTGLNVSGAPLLPVSLATPGAAYEPNVRVGEPAVPLKGTVTVRGLRAGARGVLYRFNATDALPAAAPFAPGAAQAVTPFTAAGAEWVFADPVPFPSDGATYYVAVAA
jgi:hypothetical protein